MIDITIGGQCKDCRWWAGGRSDQHTDKPWRCDMMTAHDGEGLIKQSKAYARGVGRSGLSIVFTAKDFGCVMFEQRRP